MRYPTTHEVKFFKPTINRALLRPLPSELELLPSAAAPHLKGKIKGKEYYLAISRDGFLVGFERIKHGTTAAFLGVKTPAGEVLLFWQGQDSPADIEDALETLSLPELTDAEASALPQMVLVAGKWVFLPPRNTPKVLPGGFTISY